MATDYGVDVLALDDLPDPEILGGGDINVAHALGRRLLEMSDAHQEIGDDDDYDSIDLREYLGKRVIDSELRALEAKIVKILRRDPRVLAVIASVSFGSNTLTVEVTGTGTEGPFALVLSVDSVTATLLRPGD